MLAAVGAPGVLAMSNTTAPPGPVTTIATPGRSREVEQIRALVGDLPGRGGALVVTGDPGIGKTTLLEVARRDADSRGLVVIPVAGVAVERHLPFAGLQRIVQPLAPHVTGLDEPQRRAVRRAVGNPADDGPAPTLFVLGLAVLELLGRASRTRPLVLLVDDAQWLDPPTTEVLGFLGRRLHSESAAMVLASREQAVPDALQDLPGIRLGPLEPDVARRVVRIEAPALSDAQVHHVLEVASGNPLALREPARLTASGVPVRPDARTPLTERLERVFGTGSAALPAPTRTLLLVMAVADGGDHQDALTVADRLVSLRTVPDVLGPAVSAGLVTRAPRLGFSHPLVRSALTRTAPLDDLRQVHLAWADQLAVSNPDRSAWHRAAAADVPDAAVAQALEDAADHAQHRGAFETAARWLQRAAEMSEGPVRATRLLRLGELAYRLGRYDQAQATLGTLRSGPLTEAQHDQLLWLDGAFDDDAYAAVDRVPRLVAGARRARERQEPELALQLLDAAARRCWWSGQAAPEIATAADGIVAADDPRLLVVHAHAATLQRSREILDALDDWGARAAAPHPEQAAMLTSAAFNLAHFGHALHFSRFAADGLRELGQVSGLAQIQVLTAWAALFLGRWELAYTASDEAYRLAVETRQPVWAAHARLAQADHRGRTGHTHQALELVADAERLALSTGRASTLSGVEFVRGTIELGRGRPVEAYEHLRRSFDPADRAYHPIERLWLLDHLSEAAARTDAAARVRLLVEEIHATIRDVPSPGYHQALRLARVHLADDDEIDVRVLEAHDGPGPASRWFDARVDLAHGLSLRRRRRISDARHTLRRAQVAFDDLGAHGWANRTRSELAATGASVAPAPKQAWRALSPQELQIARLASDGLTNREIGGRLYLSHRTVGSHLYRIFPKLGVTSRSQLDQVLRREPGAC
ncbi:MAG: ATP-binding protein [Propionibacteriaceae bacterium]